MDGYENMEVKPVEGLAGIWSLNPGEVPRSFSIAFGRSR